MSHVTRKIELCLLAAVVLFSNGAAAQNARPLSLLDTHYEVRVGESLPIAASAETIDFLLNAKTRTATLEGSEPSGITIASNQAGDQVFLAPSFRTKPGEYTVTITAASKTGETRQTTLDVTVKPRVTVPVNSTRAPVVLLNGWEVGFTNGCPIATTSATTFGNLAQYLVKDGVPVVYLFDNCLEDAGATIETLGNDLGAYLNTIKFDNGAQVTQIDLVAFSMGGLIARSYLAGLQADGSLNPPIPTLVGKLALIATPNFGSFVAGNYAQAIPAGTQSAELIPGSAFLWNLANWNQRTDDLRGLPAVSIIGNAGSYIPNVSSTTQLTNASDGIVTLTSGSIGFISQPSPATRIVPYCHIDPSAFTNTTIGTFLCQAAGIANVTTETHETSQIVRSFLSGTQDWKTIGTSPTTDQYLSTNGGMFFALLNTSAAYASDVSQVLWGSLPLVNGGDTNTIFYQDFVKGTGTLQASSASLGQVNCGSYTQTFGFFSAVRCKENTTIVSIGPLLSSNAKLVSAGSTITINGNVFGVNCNGCKVVATPAGSSTGQNLQIASWTNTTITATLPASMTGLVTITVVALAGTDFMPIMAAAASPATITAAPTSLQFAYTTGAAAPPAQTIQITNSGSGTLAWTATSTATWLTVSPSSGTAPASLNVSISTDGLSAGTYNGSVQISSTGASNTPLSVAVTLTVTSTTPGPTLAVSPQALTFNYAAGSSIPDPQTISITNAGSGALSWTASTTDYWVAAAPASGTAPSTLSISVNPANLAAGTYTSNVQITAAGAAGSPASIAVTLVVTGTQAAGSITSVSNAGSFQPGFASGTWLSIFGTNLSTVTYTWQASDFVNGMLPTSLEGVSVTINGKPAYVEYISPTQINVLAPDDVTTGPVAVQVTAAQQASNSVTVQKSQFSPAFFTIANGAYVAALHADYTLVARTNLISGVTSRPAQPGETILIYGTGFGPTNPPSPTAQLVSAAAPLANPVQFTIGGVTATTVFAGLTSSGLYQFNVTVPNLPAGDAAVSAVIGGASTQTGVSVTIQP